LTTASAPLNDRAAALLAAMTLEEKIGQLRQYFYFEQLSIQTTFVDAEVRAGRVGSDILELPQAIKRAVICGGGSN